MNLVALILALILVQNTVIQNVRLDVVIIVLLFAVQNAYQLAEMHAVPAVHPVAIWFVRTIVEAVVQVVVQVIATLHVIIVVQELVLIHAQRSAEGVVGTFVAVPVVLDVHLVAHKHVEVAKEDVLTQIKSSILNYCLKKSHLETDSLQ